VSDLLFSVFDLWTVLTVRRYSGVMAELIFVLNKLKGRAENLVKRTIQTRSLASKSTQPHSCQKLGKRPYLHFWLTYHRIIPLNPVNIRRIASLFTDLLFSPFRSSSARVENEIKTTTLALAKLLEKRTKKICIASFSRFITNLTNFHRIIFCRHMIQTSNESHQIFFKKILCKKSLA